MNRAEALISEQLLTAFSGVASIDGAFPFAKWSDITDAWIVNNEDVFAYYSHSDEHFLLPAYLCYLLRTDRCDPESTLYLHLSNTLREYSKERSADCFKNRLSEAQFAAVKALPGHGATDGTAWIANLVHAGIVAIVATVGQP